MVNRLVLFCGSFLWLMKFIPRVFNNHFRKACVISALVAMSGFIHIIILLIVLYQISSIYNNEKVLKKAQ